MQEGRKQAREEIIRNMDREKEEANLLFQANNGLFTSQTEFRYVDAKDDWPTKAEERSRI